MRRSRPTKERGERGRAAARLPRRKACLVRGLLVRVACAAPPPASRLKLPLHSADLEMTRACVAHAQLSSHFPNVGPP